MKGVTPAAPPPSAQPANEKMRTVADRSKDSLLLNPLLVHHLRRLEPATNHPSFLPPIETSDKLASFEYQQTQLLILNEIYRLRQDLFALQTNAQRQYPIIIQNRTEVAAQSNSEVANTKEADDKSCWFSSRIWKFFSNPLNHFFVITMFLAGSYALREHWRHTWRMAQLQSRMDSNLLVRAFKIIENALGLRK